MIEWRNSFLGLRVGVVQPRIPFYQLRVDVIANQSQALGEALLNPHVETLEIRTAQIGVGFNDAGAPAARAHRELRKASEQLRHGGGRGVLRSRQTCERVGRRRGQRRDYGLVASPHGAQVLLGKSVQLG